MEHLIRRIECEQMYVNMQLIMGIVKYTFTITPIGTFNVMRDIVSDLLVNDLNHKFMRVIISII